MTAEFGAGRSPFTPDALRDRVALVTGGGRGLGAAIARYLAAAGATVAVNYRSGREAAEAVVASIAASGGKAIAASGDVADPAAVESLFELVQGQLGPIDILV